MYGMHECSRAARRHRAKRHDTAVAWAARSVLFPAPASPAALTMNSLLLQDGGIHLQLQEVKRGKASQFFGLMGKRVRGE